MRKEYAIKALTRLRDQIIKSNELNKLGINTLEFETPLCNVIEESIAILYSKNEDNIFEYALETISWWVYENGKKIMLDEKDYDIESAENFVNYLEENYG